MSDALDYQFWGQLAGTLGLGIVILTVCGAGCAWLCRNGKFKCDVWRAVFLTFVAFFLILLFGLPIKFPEVNGKPVSGVRNQIAENSFPKAASEQGAEILASFKITPPEQKKSIFWPGYVWAIGSFLIFLRIAAGLIMTRKVVGKPIDWHQLSKVTIFESDKVKVPTSFGIFRGVIAVPLNFSERFNSEEQQVMIAHEMAHIRGRDPIWYLIANAAVAIFWWHPCVWLARRQLHCASELAADEDATPTIRQASILAECLVNFGKQYLDGNPSAGISVAGSRSVLFNRVNKLVNFQGRTPLGKVRHSCLRLLIVSFLGAVVVICSAFSKGQPAASKIYAAIKSLNESIPQNKPVTEQSKSLALNFNRSYRIHTPTVLHNLQVFISTNLNPKAVDATDFSPWDETIDAKEFGWLMDYLKHYGVNIDQIDERISFDPQLILANLDDASLQILDACIEQLRKSPVQLKFSITYVRFENVFGEGLKLEPLFESKGVYKLIPNYKVSSGILSTNSMNYTDQIRPVTSDFEFMNSFRYKWGAQILQSKKADLLFEFFRRDKKFKVFDWPTMTVASGHQAQVANIDTVTVVSARNPSGMEESYEAGRLQCGPIVDILGSMAIGDTHATVTYKLRVADFFGYASKDPLMPLIGLVQHQVDVQQRPGETFVIEFFPEPKLPHHVNERIFIMVTMNLLSIN